MLVDLFGNRRGINAADGVEVIDGGIIEDVGAKEDQQLSAGLRFRGATEEVANDRDWAEAILGCRIIRALETTEDDDLAAHGADERIGRAPADDGLVVAIDGHGAEDIFDLLRHLELDGAILADERQHLELNADITLRDCRARHQAGGPTGGLRAGNDGAGFTDEDGRFLVVGSGDGGDGEHIQVVLGRRGRSAEVDDACERAVGSEGGRATPDTGDAAGTAEERAVDARQLTIGDGHAEGGDAATVVTRERDFGDDDLDANLREDHVDLID